MFNLRPHIPILADLVIDARLWGASLKGVSDVGFLSLGRQVPDRYQQILLWTNPSKRRPTGHTKPLWQTWCLHRTTILPLDRKLHAWEKLSPKTGRRSLPLGTRGLRLFERLRYRARFVQYRRQSGRV